VAENLSNIKQVLMKAIYREQSAHDFYHELSGRIEDPDGARIFSNLAGDEAVHRRKLEGWWEDKFDGAFQFDAPRVKPIKVVVSKKVDALAALELALQAESEAAHEYESIAKSTEDEGLKEICSTLETINAEIQSISDAFYWFDIDLAGHMEE